MSEQSQQGLTQVLKHEGKLLGLLLQKISELEKLKQIIDGYLDNKLAAKCFIANYEDGQLAVITESAIWATQFRFQIPSLEMKLRKHAEFKFLQRITCKVRPALTKIEPAKKKMHSMELLSPETSQFIKDIAKSISDERLKAIMNKIAERS